MKFKLITAISISATFLSGCETNPSINNVAVKIAEAVFKTNSEINPITSSTVPAVSVATNQAKPTNIDTGPKVPAQQQTVNIRKDDPTGLIGKVITPPTLPKNSDIQMMYYGNNYYSCGGAVYEGNIHIEHMRKGIKTKCIGNTMILALTRSSNNNKTYEFLDAIEVLIPKGYELKYGNCKGGAIALSKFEDVKDLTKHLKAWKIENNSFMPITNLKTVSCENEGYGL